jgi:hypothetical protein
LKAILREYERERNDLNGKIDEIKIEIQKALEPPVPEGGFKVTCVSSSGYLMKEPEYSSKIVSKIPLHATLIIKNRKLYNGYFQAEYGESSGYVHQSAIKFYNETDALVSPTKSSSTPKSTSSSPSRTYHTGPKGGCYYVNSAGNKVYVDKSYCN